MLNHHRKFQKWLHLYREGELNPGQKRSLDIHLNQCAQCRQIQIKMNAFAKSSAIARKKNITFTNSALLTQSLLTHIKSFEKKPGVFDRLALPVIRLSAASALFIILFSFFLQEGYDQYQINRLSGRNSRSQILFLNTQALPQNIVNQIIINVNKNNGYAGLYQKTINILGHTLLSPDGGWRMTMHANTLLLHKKTTGFDNMHIRSRQ